MPVQKPIEKIIEKSFRGIPIASKLTFKTMSRSATFHVFSPSLSLPVRSPVCQSMRTQKSTTSNMLPKTTRPTPVAQNPRGTRDFFFRDQFAHCPWVHVSQDGEQCENGNVVFCLPYGLWLPSDSEQPFLRRCIMAGCIQVRGSGAKTGPGAKTRSTGPTASGRWTVRVREALGYFARLGRFLNVGVVGTKTTKVRH